MIAACVVGCVLARPSPPSPPAGPSPAASSSSGVATPPRGTNAPTTPTSSAVTLTGMASSGGWLVAFHVPPKSRDLAYRMPDDREFEELGTMPQAIVPFDRLHGPTVIEVRYTDENGIPRGPEKATFDPKREAVTSVKSIFGMVSEWIAFRPVAELDPKSGGVFVYFTTLIAYKYALSEIRYSVDDDSLDKTVRFTASDRPGIAADDELYITLPKPPAFVAVKMIYADGSESAARRFAPTSVGVGATMLPKSAVPPKPSR